MKIGYLCSRYPSVSHTFIRREVEALRNLGVDLETFAVRRTEDQEIISDEDRRDRDTTWSILPRGPLDLVRSNLRSLVRRPRAYVSTLVKALHHRIPGAKSGLWSLFYFVEALRLAEELERRGIDHLHNHFSNAGGDVGYLATRYLGIGWSVTLHGSSDFDGPNRPLLGRKIAAADFVACVTHFGRALAMHASDPAHWDRIVLVRCGIDLSSMPFRAPLERSGRTPRILTVGRLSPEKGQVGLIRAFADIRGRGFDAELVIIGDGPERARLEAEIETLGLAGDCRLAGAMSSADVLQAMAEADVFAMTSFIEGLPVVLMESMAIGCPVIAPRITGIPELVEDGVTGLLYAPANWRELADRLVRVLDDEPFAHSLAVRGRQRVEGEFRVSQAVQPLLAKFAPELTSSGPSSVSGPAPARQRAVPAPCR